MRRYLPPRHHPKFSFWKKLCLTWRWIRLKFPWLWSTPICPNTVIKVAIYFDLEGDKLEKLKEAEELLHEAGLKFDTGWPFGYREWVVGYDLEAPIRVVYSGKMGEGQFTPFHCTLADIWR